MWFLTIFKFFFNIPWKKIIEVIIKNWKLAIIAGLLILTYFNNSTIESQEKTITNISGQLKDKKAEVIIANSLIGKQNEAIGALEDMRIAFEGRIKGLGTVIDLIDKEYKEKLISVMNEKVPESCEGTMDWMVDKAVTK